MTRPTVTHLVDDTTAGGVMRVLDHISTCPEMARTARHTVLPVSRATMATPPIEGDIIVSHLSISWRRLPWFVALRARHADRPILHVEHSYTEGFIGANVPRPARLGTLLTTAYSLFERVVAVSAAQADWLARAQLVDEVCLVTIPSTVALRPFLHMLAVSRAPRVIGAIGRLEPQKGFDTLIRALRAAPASALELHIYGEGSERARLEALAAGDPRIRFKGHADPVAAMRAVDAVAMPSRWEAYGLVALEARAAGRRLLVAPVDGLQDHAAEGAQMVGTTVADWTAALEHMSLPGDAGRMMDARRNAAQAERRFADGWAALIAGLVAARDVQAAA